MAIHKVLVVDDAKTELMFIFDLLQKNEFEVATADGGEQAMQCLAAQKPDLISQIWTKSKNYANFKPD
jgi:twitching motility two-component system response regulator PilH